MGFVLAAVVFFAQAAGVALLIGVGLVLLGRTRQAAVLWLLAVITVKRLPLSQEFEALGDGVLLRDRARLAGAAARLRGGDSLAAALSATPGLVPDDAVLLAHVGERSGRIGEALAVEAERIVRIRGAAVSPTTSPALALMYLVAIPVLIPFIVIFVVPKFMKIWHDFGAPLPRVTESLIETSDAFATYWYVPVLVGLGGVLLAAVLLFLARAKGWSLGLPRSITPGGRGRRASLALRALAVPAAAGRPLSDALDPMAAVAPNRSDRRRFARLRDRHAAGANVWDALASEHVVSRRDAQLFAAAERAGNLPWALHLVADRIDDARCRRFAAFVEVAQPTVVLLLGALVAFLCIAFFLPLVDLIDRLGRSSYGD